jgi:hypothetical protein
MAIQIDEKLLSPRAREALANAKSKSKLLRDALEAYIRNDPNQSFAGNVQDVGDPEVKQDIKDIKDMLLKLTRSNVQSEISSCIEQQAATAEIGHSKGLKTANVAMNKVEIKEDKQADYAHVKEKAVQSEIKPESIKKAAEPVKQGDSNTMSEEQKKKIEEMYDASLDGFGLED